MQNLTESLSKASWPDDRPSFSLERVSMAVCCGMIFLTNVCMNTGILVTLYRQADLRVATNIVVAAISGNDLLVATSCVFTQWITFCVGFWTFGEKISYVTAFISSFCRVISTFCVTFLAVTRYLSLRDLSWSGPCTRTVNWFLLLSSGIALVVALPWYIGVTETYFTYNGGAEKTQEYAVELCLYSIHRGTWILYQVTLCRIFPFAITIYSAVKMVCILHGIAFASSTFGTNNQIRIAAEMKNAITVLILATVHVLCQMPLSVNELLMVYVKRENGVFIIHPFIVIFAWMNTAINPIVFFIRNPNLRHLLNIKRHCIRNRNRNYELCTEDQSARNRRMTSMVSTEKLDRIQLQLQTISKDVCEENVKDTCI